MRKAFVKALCEVAQKDKRIMLLTGDLGFNILEEFKYAFPERFLNIGVAEANLVTVAAGLSTTGYTPFIYSIATFMTMRPFEQIRNDVSLQKLNVKIVGVGGGLSYTKAGPTHHSMEDIALMRMLPDMVIVAPFDQDETYAATKVIARYRGPVYLRIGRNPEMTVPLRKRKFVLGKGMRIRKGKEIALLITGPQIVHALEAVSQLERKNIFPSLYVFSTINPLDTTLIRSIVRKYPFLCTLEEHRINGGFGTAVLETVNDSWINPFPNVLRLGLKNQFTPLSAEYNTLLNYHGITPEKIASAVYTFMKNKTMM